MKRSPLDALVTENSLRIVSGRFGDSETRRDQTGGQQTGADTEEVGLIPP